MLENSDSSENFEFEDDPSAHYEFVVDEEQAAQRLDRFLSAQFPEISRTHLQTLIAEGRIQVSGIVKKPSHKLEAGETVTVEIPAPPSPGVEPENIPLDFLYQDEDMAVINKPAGMTVHPGAGADTGTLVAALLHHFGPEQAAAMRKLSTIGGPLRPGIVHRLDKLTSGAIVIARTDAAHENLVEQFRARRVRKKYLALLHGAVEGEKGRIELPITRDLRRRSRMTARRSEGREARTDWRLLMRLGSYSLIEADLHTGRTHQIRVHFSALGFPVVGDALYGAPHQERIGHALLPDLGRNYLHAARIALEHPRTGKPLEFRAPLPQELPEYLRAMGALTQSLPAAIDAALKDYL